MIRPIIPNQKILYMKAQILKELDKNIMVKGAGSFTSSHETLGCVTEEYKELTDAVHSKDMKKIEEELLDIIGAAAWGLASLYNKTLNW